MNARNEYDLIFLGVVERLEGGLSDGEVVKSDIVFSVRRSDTCLRTSNTHRSRSTSVGCSLDTLSFPVVSRIDSFYTREKKRRE